MRTANKNFKAGIAILMIMSSMSLTACGKKLTAITPVPVATATPTQSEILPDPYASTPAFNNSSVPTGTPNSQVGNFKVDQATLSDWQAKGIAVTGGTIYLSVSDVKGLSQKGSIVKMNSSDGKGWKDIGANYLGLSHPIAKTVEGIAVLGGNIVAVDPSASKTYLIDAAKGGVKTLSSAGGRDVAAGGGSLFIAGTTVDKTDSSVSSRTPMNGLTATAGVGADNQGNVYAVSGVTIKKADTTGQVQDVVTTDLSTPIDVAADSRNGDIYVLDGTMVKRFSSSGQLIVNFSSGAGVPVAIAIDEAGAIYVADKGATNADSKVIKFAASLADTNSGSSYSNNNSSYGNSSNSSYGGYSNGSGSSNSSYGSYSVPQKTAPKSTNTDTRKQPV
ncbi:MAG: hypothetical protein H7263_07505 [Candidatus Sericytochromatia bacterium]|nr:hypothetical protein [Candidatus Sericytochromatia bacterium]